MMHFNHFVKLHDFKFIDKECRLLLMTRGAGVLHADNHASIDAVNVFLQSGTKLTINNLGLILYKISITTLATPTSPNQNSLNP